MSFYCIRCGTSEKNYKCTKCHNIVNIEDQKFLFPLNARYLDLINKEYNNKSLKETFKEEPTIKNVSKDVNREDSMLSFMKDNKKTQPIFTNGRVPSNESSENKSKEIKEETDKKKKVDGVYEPIRSPRITSNSNIESSSSSVSNSSNNEIGSESIEERLSLKTRRIITLIFIVSFVISYVALISLRIVDIGLLFIGSVPLISLLYPLATEVSMDNYNFFKGVLCFSSFLPTCLFFKNVCDFEVAILSNIFYLAAFLLYALLSHLNYGKKKYKFSLIVFCLILASIGTTMIMHTVL